MASQEGIIKIKGTMGGITFMKTQDGFIAREKGGVSGSRIKNDPKFARTRENGAEFGRAGKASKMLRKALRSLILGLADSRATSRLMTEFMKAIHADTTNFRGERTVTLGEVGFLKGFEFNARVRLESTFVAPYAATINRTTGQTTISIPAFNPSQVIVAPAGATHCRIVSAGAQINFEDETYTGANNASADIDLRAAEQTAINLMALVQPGTSPIFVALGIEFYQQVNGRLYALSNGAFNALSIVSVEGSTAARVASASQETPGEVALQVSTEDAQASAVLQASGNSQFTAATE